MEHVLDSITNSFLPTLAWMAAFFVTFGILARFTPCNPEQPVVRKGMIVDILYTLILPLGGRFVRIGFLSAGIFLFYHNETQETLDVYFTYGFGPLAQMPIWLQAAIIFIVSDFVLYWTHRLFHGKKLWRFHAVHHSTKHVDWLSAYRFHPVNTWLTFTLVDAIIMLVGFSPLAVSCMGVVNTIYSALVHANLNWTFGPFRYVFSSPVFHRWHHTSQAEGIDKNFAPTFPLLDIMFGTFYMPDGELPKHYGIIGSEIPNNFVDHMLWPFKKK